jgi:spore coat polysaccharide biosynthesis protein SpsF (cytidylyltransferase family)
MADVKYFLDGERIGLSKLSRDEATQSYLDWMNDPEVTRYLVSGSFPTTMEDLHAFIDQANAPGRVTFAIHRKDERRHVGNVKLDHIDWISRRCDLGILIGDKASWGMGLGTEATALATRYAFERLGMERVTLGVLAENAAALRVYEKLGYAVEGRRERDQYKDGRWLDTVLMAASRRRFLGRNDRVVAVIQARMSSTRLPGKILKPLAGKPALFRLVERACAVPRLDEVVLATSDAGGDDEVAALGGTWGLRVVRGPLDDVLARTCRAANEARADVVVRLTGDCPMHDPAVIARAIETWAGDVDVDYVSNVDERTYPDGLDVEVCSFAALDEAHERARSPSEREHVTPWIRRHKRKLSFVQDQDLSELRWTLDQGDDFEFLSAAFDACQRGASPFSSLDVYRWLSTATDRIWIGSREYATGEKRAELVQRMERLLKETEAVP